MKRDQKIARLVAVGYNARELHNMPNQNLGVVYEMARPRLERMAARVQAANREHQRIENERRRVIAKLQAAEERVREAEMDFARQTAWMRRCVKVPFQPIEAHYPTPTLDFGLAALLAYAKHMHAKFGDQDAAATLRVVGTIKLGAH